MVFLSFSENFRLLILFSPHCHFLPWLSQWDSLIIGTYWNTESVQFQHLKKSISQLIRLPFTHQWSCRRQRGNRQWPSWQRRYSCSQAWQRSILHRNFAIKSIVQQKNPKIRFEVNKFKIAAGKNNAFDFTEWRRGNSLFLKACLNFEFSSFSAFLFYSRKFSC